MGKEALEREGSQVETDNQEITPQNFYLVSYVHFEDVCILYVTNSYEEAKRVLDEIKTFVKKYAENAIEYENIEGTEETIEANYKIRLGLARDMGLERYPFFPFLVKPVHFWREDPNAFVIMSFEKERGEYLPESWA